MADALVAPARRSASTRTLRRRLLHGLIWVVLAVYGLGTIFPFYVLFVRSFVSTRESTNLHLWIPPTEEVSLNARVGSLAVYYNLDLRQFKQDLGLPATAFLLPQTTLAEVAEEYEIAPETMRSYFSRFSVWTGWYMVLTGGDFFLSLGRTLLITVASIVGLNILSLLTGYGLAGLRRRDQMVIYNIYLLQAVIPPILIILPQFLIMRDLGLINTYLAVILVNIKGGALATMIFTSYITAIPTELEEAAEIDGAGRLEYLWYVLAPLTKVPIATLTAISLPQFWNQFLQPYVYLEKGDTTLLPFIQHFAGDYSTNFQAIYAAIFLSVLPLIVLYVAFRGLFVRAQLSGAIKG